MSAENLAAMFARADRIDVREGMVAYNRYRLMMFAISEHYDVSIDRVTAAFVAMSPNNDYVGNLRSLISVLEGRKRGLPAERITISTYRHCMLRALDYLSGAADFLASAAGLKIINFYHNILTPDNPRFVTIDGHICATWMGKRLTMKEAIVRKPGDYNEISDAIKGLAFRELILPNQYQAILWFARKRVMNVVYDPQLDLFTDPNDIWRTYRHISSIKPYEERNG